MQLWAAVGSSVPLSNFCCGNEVTYLKQQEGVLLARVEGEGRDVPYKALSSRLPPSSREASLAHLPVSQETLVYLLPTGSLRLWMPHPGSHSGLKSMGDT